jgi:hypothetical protein
MFPIVLAGAMIAFSILAAVTTYWQAIIALPASAAAFLGALSGAGGGLLAIILGALINAELNRRRDDRLRREEGRSLALSLRGEMLSVVDSYVRHQSVLALHLNDFTNRTGVFETHPGLPTYSVPTHLACSVTIFSKCCDRLGLLEDPSLIANIAQFYTSIPQVDELEDVAPEIYQTVCQGRVEVAETAIERAEFLAERLGAVAARLV